MSEKALPVIRWHAHTGIRVYDTARRQECRHVPREDGQCRAVAGYRNWLAPEYTVAVEVSPVRPEAARSRQAPFRRGFEARAARCMCVVLQCPARGQHSEKRRGCLQMSYYRGCLRVQPCFSMHAPPILPSFCLLPSCSATALPS